MQETLQELLQVLHERGGMQRGMVSLLDPEKGELLVSAVQGQDPGQRGNSLRAGGGYRRTDLQQGKSSYRE
ncbi:MAG: hypothetical protein R3F37_22555 [Candidatus Competibacteraceae bacterium]